MLAVVVLLGDGQLAGSEQLARARRQRLDRLGLLGELGLGLQRRLQRLEAGRNLASLPSASPMVCMTG